MITQIVEATEQHIDACGQRIRDGKLVSFPTETVYGLGASALNPEACLTIFKAKQRPLTDPLIVHIHDKEQVKKILEPFNEVQSRVFNVLTEAFWPGPLTLVAKAQQHIPLVLSANTGFIGVRMPNHPVALALLRASNLPIAAPSANLFGHVSPTKAEHVLNDFQPQKVDLHILDGGNLDTGCCAVGIESSVVKFDKKKLTVFREGGVSVNQIKKILKEEGLEIEVEVRKKETKKKEAEVAPGQELTHYAPNLNTYLLEDELQLPSRAVPNNLLINYFDAESSTQEKTKILKSETVLISLNSLAREISNQYLKELVLSETGNDVSEAAQNLFSMLREAEKIQGAKYCLIVLPRSKAIMLQDLYTAVRDRVFRSSSGKTVSQLA
eukprot:augustus_masked-scaffold_3-processed-gene-7.48-mRNA-1 protein AED:0.01 eAED:0.01 QI:0/-1/0/1/-1/1/1/0/382